MAQLVGMEYASADVLALVQHAQHLYGLRGNTIEDDVRIDEDRTCAAHELATRLSKLRNVLKHTACGLDVMKMIVRCCGRPFVRT